MVIGVTEAGDAGFLLPYGNYFSASPAQMNMVGEWLFQQQHKGTFECCAEPMLHAAEQCGCISPKNFALLGLPLDKHYLTGF